MKDIFDILILNARPAAGKSEIISFLGKTSSPERRKRFHLGELREIDDFPMLWTWFEEDSILESLGKPRLHSTTEGYFKEEYLWNLLIRRISLEYDKISAEEPDLHGNTSVLMEFSRGTEHGGYRQAYGHLSKRILSRAAILYLDVSWEESLRKNRKRKNPDKPHSILEHSLEDEKLETLYRYDDFHELTPGTHGYMEIQGLRVPFCVFENEDDVTTAMGPKLAGRLERVLDTLWSLYSTRTED